MMVGRKEAGTMQSPAVAKLASPSAEKPPVATRASPPRTRPSPAKLSLEGRSQEARLMAAAILEVLAGVRTPTDASGALGVSLPRYYALEVRALEGLLQACERRPRGPRRSAERELGKLRRDVERLKREAARSQALLRASQRAVGLRFPEAAKPKADPSGKKRRKRRPTTRALRAVELLRPPADRGLEPAAEAKHNAGELKP
jgi:hypothetical protein